MINPSRGVLFQDPFCKALWGAYAACCPSFFRGRTAPIGCPRHSGVSLACEWQNQWSGKELCQGSLNISPLNLPRNYIMAACLCWAMTGGRRRWGRGDSEGHTWDAMKVQHQEFDSKGQQAFFTVPFNQFNGKKSHWTQMRQGFLLQALNIASNIEINTKLDFISLK